MHTRAYTHTHACAMEAWRGRDVLGHPGGGEMKDVAQGDWRRGGHGAAKSGVL